MSAELLYMPFLPLRIRYRWTVLSESLLSESISTIRIIWRYEPIPYPQYWIRSGDKCRLADEPSSPYTEKSLVPRSYWLASSCFLTICLLMSGSRRFHKRGPFTLWILHPNSLEKTHNLQPLIAPVPRPYPPAEAAYHNPTFNIPAKVRATYKKMRLSNQIRVHRSKRDSSPASSLTPAIETHSSLVSSIDIAPLLWSPSLILALKRIPDNNHKDLILNVRANQKKGIVMYGKQYKGQRSVSTCWEVLYKRDNSL